MTEYEIKTGDKVEKYHVALLVKKGSEWVQIAKATDNTINLNAETEEVDYITDKSATTLIKSYKPSFSSPLTLVKGSPDYDYFFDKFYNLPTGADANGELLIVYMNEKDESGNYKAWDCDVTFTIDNLNPVSSQLTVNIQVNGTIRKGTVKVTAGDPTFTPEGTTPTTPEGTE